MVLKLYVDPLSQPARAVMLFVRAANIKVDQEVIISIPKGEHRTPEYEKINKFQKIPAIVHNDFHLAESVAIFRYLAAEFKVADHWYPKSSRGMARVDEYLSWQHMAIRLPFIRFILMSWKPELLSAIPPTEEVIREHKAAMEDALNNFVKKWISGSSFINGDQISVADLMAVCEIEMLRLVGYDPRAGRPKLGLYMTRVRATLEPFYDQVHSTMYQAEKMFAKK